MCEKKHILDSVCKLINMQRSIGQVKLTSCTSANTSFGLQFSIMQIYFWIFFLCICIFCGLFLVLFVVVVFKPGCVSMYEVCSFDM